MPFRDWKLRVRDILQAIIEVQQFTTGMTFQSFQEDNKTVKAVLYNFASVGEATNRIPLEIQSQHSQVPWHLMRGMRNVMVHQYFQVDLEIVWQTIGEEKSE